MRRPLGKVAINSRFGKIEDLDEYIVINVDTSYSVLLRRPRMHKNAAVPSTYHQCVKYPLRGARGTITTDNDSFSTVETYHAESRFYKAKGKEKVDETDVRTTIRSGTPWPALPIR